MRLNDSGGSAYQSQVPAVARAWVEKQKELTKPQAEFKLPPAPSWAQPATTPKSSATPVPQSLQNYQTTKFEQLMASEPTTAFRQGALPASLQPTDPELQLMTSKGWALPSSLQPKRADEQDKAEFTPLTEFTYTADDDEVALIREKYSTDEAKAFGFGVPAKSDTAETAVTSLMLSQVPEAALAPALNRLTVENEVKPLTWEEYEKLSDDQRRAVDFNSLLVDARERDLNLKNVNRLDKEQQKEYDDQVLAMFGSGGGSETFAPNTVGLLAQIDFKAVGQDLDEYLSLERAVDVDELKDFKLDESTIQQLETRTIEGQSYGYGTTRRQDPSRTVSNYAEVRSPENLAALDSAVVGQFGDKITEVMTASDRAVWDVLDAFSTKPLGSYTTEEVPFGYGNATLRAGTAAEGLDEWIQNAYSHLLNPANTTAMEDVKADLQALDPEHQQAFWDYFESRTRNELNYGALPMQDEAGLDIVGGMRSAKELRTLAGLGD